MTNIAVTSTTMTRIRPCIALTGSTLNSAAPAAVLQQQHHAARLPLPPQLVLDRAGGWGKTRAQVDAVRAGQTTIGAWIPTSGGSAPHRFSVADFRVDVARTGCACPNGVVRTTAYQHGEGDGVFFRVLASQCAGGPRWGQCRDPEASPKGHRADGAVQAQRAAACAPAGVIRAKQQDFPSNRVQPSRKSSPSATKPLLRPRPRPALRLGPA